jgi:hypothetical protein
MVLPMICCFLVASFENIPIIMHALVSSVSECDPTVSLTSQLITPN